MDERIEKTLLKEDMQMTNKHMKDGQHHLCLGKCKSKPQKDATSHPLRWLLYKKY